MPAIETGLGPRMEISKRKRWPSPDRSNAGSDSSEKALYASIGATV